MNDVINLKTISSGVKERYKNIVIQECSSSCLRMSVNNGLYDWHLHPNSDELFIGLSGELHIELEDGTIHHLKPWDFIKIPAGMVHRTFSHARTVNLTYELIDLETQWIDHSRHNSELDLTVKNVKTISDGIEDQYRSIVLETVNEDVFRLEINQGVYDWHVHPNSQELLIGVEGAMEIELEKDTTVQLGPEDLYLVDQGVSHKTSAMGRKVSVTFESSQTKTEHQS